MLEIVLARSEILLSTNALGDPVSAAPEPVRPRVAGEFWIVGSTDKDTGQRIPLRKIYYKLN